MAAFDPKIGEFILLLKEAHELSLDFAHTTPAGIDIRTHLRAATALAILRQEDIQDRLWDLEKETRSSNEHNSKP